ncbi:MAG TPA: type II toxin-antitoxin system RelE/ParE family toxin, partial [Thermomicrobiales bacterium]|nr:type II toxin-antitoxin system RelE/ParE family toxin [Thermomicrobiales bacterium]
MTYDVRISDRAFSYLERLDRSTQHRILDRLEQIASDPFGYYTKPLSNARGMRSSRVGNWRIVFSVNDTERIVDVS